MSSENMIAVVQLLSCVWLFATPWTAACQVSLFFTISQSLLKLMTIKLMMPSNHLTLCRPLLLLPSIFPSIRVSSNNSVLRIRWPKYWIFSICGILQARTLEWVAISFSNAWKWKGKWSCSVVSDSQQPHGLQPTRLLCPWGFPGKSTGVGCHCLLRRATARIWENKEQIFP